MYTTAPIYQSLLASPGQSIGVFHQTSKSDKDVCYNIMNYFLIQGGDIQLVQWDKKQRPVLWNARRQWMHLCVKVVLVQEK